MMFLLALLSRELSRMGDPALLAAQPCKLDSSLIPLIWL